MSGCKGAKGFLEIWGGKAWGRKKGKGIYLCLHEDMDDTPSPHATVRVVIFIIYILKQYGKDACAAAPNKYEKETI